MKQKLEQFRDVFDDLFEGVYFTDDYIESGVAISKGELCARLGATLLIDDNPDFCDSAKECGIETILFGNYGWQKSRAGNFKLCRSWDELPDLID